MTGAERKRLKTVVRAAAHARSASQPKLDATGAAATLNERLGDAERLKDSVRAGIGVAGATMGAGTAMDGPLWAQAGAAAVVTTTAASTEEAARVNRQRPDMVHTVAIPTRAVKLCSDQAVCLPLGSMGS